MDKCCQQKHAHCQVWMSSLKSNLLCRSRRGRQWCSADTVSHDYCHCLSSAAIPMNSDGNATR
jgi:hypothetical protein